MTKGMTFAALGQLLTRIGAQCAAGERAGLAAAGRLLEAEAKASIGEYQKAAGPFPAWEPLHYATLYGGVSPSGFHFKGKVELGFAPPDNPLLRTGAMRDSIGHEVRGRALLLGSTSEIAKFHEWGTRYMAPRPFLGGAMARRLDDAGDAIALHVFAPLVGRIAP